MTGPITDQDQEAAVAADLRASRAAVTDRMPGQLTPPRPASPVLLESPTPTTVNVAVGSGLIEITPRAGPVAIVTGWRTSEFWLKIAAFALTMLFGSGALTNNTELAIAGMAAAMLGALGYTVSRTVLKVKQVTS